MADTGSGTGTPITPLVCPATPPWTTADLPSCQAVSQARYVEILGIPECGFWGVNNPDDPSSCRTIWLRHEREIIRRQLLEAQSEIEQILGHPLNHCWVQGERKRYRYPLVADKVKVVSAGVPALAYIDDDAVVDHSADPAVVGPIATTVTDADEVRVFYAASLTDDMVEITPSRVVLTGGLLTMYIPRCRLVHPDYWNNSRTGVPYSDLTRFCSVVDVMRVYNDPSTHATLVWPHVCDGCASCTCCPTCGEYTHAACIYIRDARIGSLDILPATYSGGAWTRSSASCCGTPEYVEYNYRAGVRLRGPDRWERARQAEDAVIRLAHSKMPEEPCSCEVTSYYWKRDRNVPAAFTRERINCPFGLSDGAWIAWRFANVLRPGKAGVL